MIGVILVENRLDRAYWRKWPLVLAIRALTCSRWNHVVPVLDGYAVHMDLEGVSVHWVDDMLRLFDREGSTWLSYGWNVERRLNPLLLAHTARYGPVPTLARYCGLPVEPLNCVSLAVSILRVHGIEVPSHVRSPHSLFRFCVGSCQRGDQPVGA